MIAPLGNDGVCANVASGRAAAAAPTPSQPSASRRVISCERGSFVSIVPPDEGRIIAASAGSQGRREDGRSRVSTKKFDARLWNLYISPRWTAWLEDEDNFRFHSDKRDHRRGPP